MTATFVTTGPGPIVVAGSLNMDLVMRLPRVPGPGETLSGHDFSTVPGGKGANQAVACARMGAPVAMVGRVGADANGRTLLDALKTDAIDGTQVAALDGVSTGVAIILVEDDGQNRIALAAGANGRLDEGAIDVAGPTIERAAMLVMQLEVPMPAVLRAARRARAAGVPVLLNAAPVAALPDALWALVDTLVVNETEAAALAALPADNPRDAQIAAAALCARGPARVIVTLGANGVVAYECALGGRHWPAHRVDVVDTTAAGDTFIGALCAALREGAPLVDAIALGQAASALCVTRPGAQPSIPYRGELVGAYAPRKDNSA